MLIRLLALVIIVGLFWAIKRYLVDQQSQNKHSNPNSASANDYDEAIRILDLHEPITEDKVLEAYKRLMNKVHPDKGGSPHFAAQLNRAKQTLLQHLNKH